MQATLEIPFKPDEGTPTDEDGYKGTFLRDFEGKTFEGEPSITELRENEYGTNAYLKLTDEEAMERLIVPIRMNITEDEDGDEIIIAYKNGVLYDFVDSLYAQIHGTKEGVTPRYKMYADEFEDLADAINDKLESMTIKVIKREFKDQKTKEMTEFKSIVVKNIELY